MDFSLTPEQELLRSQARSFLAERFPPARVAELADSPEGWDPSSWHELAQLGWLGVSVAEEAGGAGLGFLEEAVLFEELGRALYPGPYFSTVALALPALPAELQADVAAGRTRWSAALDGGLVPDLALVDRVLVPSGARLLAVPATGEALETVDATRRLGRLVESAEGEEIGPAAGLAAIRTRAFAALALEAVGVAQRALELGVEHARSRQQFGRPIGVYQAVAHRLADTYVETELARSLAYWAAWCVAEDDEQAALAAAAAKSYAGEAAVAACERSIQVHGGIGFTWEHVLHRYYRRALWIEAFGGFGARLRAEVGRALLAGAGASGTVERVAAGAR
jgi:alkylation response protein AidB-like acyl-CoA dehydrogenase